MKYSYWNGSAWIVQIADSSSNVGWCCALALDSTGRAHISYLDAANLHLRYISSVNESGFLTSQVVVPPAPTPTPSPAPSSTPRPTSTPAPTTTPSLPSTATATSLDFACKSASSNSGLNVQAEGALTADGNGVPNADIQLAYSADAGTSWSNLATAKTNSSGRFSCTWNLPSTGVYLVNATYKGNSTYQSVSRTVNFAVAPIEKNNVLSITSNSTVSQIAFSSTSLEFSFTVNGTSGTSGYVNFYIAKSLVRNIDGLSVYLDGDKLPYTVASHGDSWLVSFTYHHSSHHITIELGSASAASSNLTGYWVVALIVPLIIAGIIIYVIYKPQKTKPN